MEQGTATLIPSERPSEHRSSEQRGEEPGIYSRPVDLVHLARYTLGNKALEREILDLFVTQSLTTLSRLEAASSDKDWKDYAHAMLGSARAIGAKRLADQVLVAQRLADGPRDRRRGAVLADVKAEMDRTNRYIRELFPEE